MPHYGQLDISDILSRPQWGRHIYCCPGIGNAFMFSMSWQCFLLMHLFEMVSRFVTVKSHTDKCFKRYAKTLLLSKFGRMFLKYVRLFVCQFSNLCIYYLSKFKKYLLIVLICRFVCLLFVYTWSVLILYQWVCYFLSFIVITAWWIIPKLGLDEG